MSVGAVPAPRPGLLERAGQFLIRMSGATSGLESPAPWFVEWATGGRSYTGKAVNRVTAMQCTAVYGCVRIIASTLASLPVQVREKTPRGSRILEDHPVTNLLGTPNPATSNYTFHEMRFERLLLDGNAYGAIFRLGNFRPVELIVMDRENVQRPRRIDGRLKYPIVWSNPDDARETTMEIVDQDFVLHTPNLGFDGRCSPSPITHAARQAVGLALGLEEHQARYVGSGGRPTGALEIPQGVSPEAAQAIKDDWRSEYGTLSQAGKTALLYGGAKYHPISFTQQDAEILASRRMQVAEIARIYGVPLHLLFETEKVTSWGSGLEEQSRAFLRYTLRSHIRRDEAELSRKLLRNDERETMAVRYDADDLLRGTAKDMADFYEGMVQKAAIMTPNEARDREGMPPLEGGDQLRQPTGAPAQPAAS